MVRCLYSYVQLNENDPPDDATSSLEHIVAHALGGCRDFSIPYCSKKANNDFGRDIDAPFLALPVVGFKRHELGLKSYSGSVPDIVFNGECVELGKKCRIVFPDNGSVYADFGIDVSGSLAVGAIDFSGSEDRLRGAVNALIKKASRQGLAVATTPSALVPATSFDDAKVTAIMQSGETLHFRIDFGQDAFFTPWSRGIVKMALGLGAYALGKAWAFSTEADLLRSCLICDASSLAGMPLQGSTATRLSSEIADFIGIRPGRHTLAVLPCENSMIACISLFGGELFDGIINLGSGPADIKVSNGQLPPDWKCVFHIDPVTRTLTTLTISDLKSNLDAAEI